MKLHSNIVSLDIETMGLDPVNHDIYDIGIVAPSPDDANEFGDTVFDQRYKPRILDEVIKDPEVALKSSQLTSFAYENILRFDKNNNVEAKKYYDSIIGASFFDPQIVHSDVTKHLENKQLWIFNLPFEQKFLDRKLGINLQAVATPQMKMIEEVKTRIKKNQYDLKSSFVHYRNMLENFKSIATSGAQGAFDILDLAKSTMAVAVERGMISAQAMQLRGSDLATGLNADIFAKTYGIKDVFGNIGENHIAKSDAQLNLLMLREYLDMSTTILDPNKTFAHLSDKQKKLLKSYQDDYLQNKIAASKKQVASTYDLWNRGLRDQETKGLKNVDEAIRLKLNKSLGRMGENVNVTLLANTIHSEGRRDYFASRSPMSNSSLMERSRHVFSSLQSTFPKTSAILSNKNNLVKVGMGLGFGLPVLSMAQSGDFSFVQAGAGAGLSLYALSKIKPNLVDSSLGKKAGVVGLGLAAFNLFKGNTYSAFREEGLAPEQRHEKTSFGSGYQGLEHDSGVASEISRFLLSPTGIGLLGSAYPLFRPRIERLLAMGSGTDLSELAHLGLPTQTYKTLTGRTQASVSDYLYNAMRRAEKSSGSFHMARIFEAGTLFSGNVFKADQFIEILNKPNTNDLIRYYAELAGKSPQEFERMLTSHGGSGILFSNNALHITDQSKQMIDKAFTTNIAMLNYKYAQPSIEEVEVAIATGSPLPTGYRSSLIKSFAEVRGLNLDSEEFLAYPRYFPGSFGRKIPEIKRDLLRSFKYYFSPFTNVAAKKTAELAKSPISSVADIFPEEFVKYVGERTTLISNKVRSRLPWLPTMKNNPFFASEVGTWSKLGESLFSKLPMYKDKVFAETTMGHFWRGGKTIPTIMAFSFASKSINDLIYSATGTSATGYLAKGLGGLQSIYAGVSDILGLTPISKFQEEIGAPAGISGAIKWNLGMALSGGLLGAGIGIGTSLYKEATSVPQLRAKVVEEAGKHIRGFSGKGFKYGGLAGLVTSIPFALGMLGSTKTMSEQYEESFEGKEIPYGKGRWWLMNRTPWEGSKTDFHAPSLLSEEILRSREKTMYGEDLQEDPFLRAYKETPILSDFYRPEYFKDKRNYPVSGPSGEGLGIYGTLYEATLGRIINPPTYREEARIGEGFVPTPYSSKYNTATELGEVKPPETISPYDTKFLLSEAMANATELLGLRGFIFSSFTGSEELGLDHPVLESSKNITGRRLYWDRSIGDPGFCLLQGSYINTKQGRKKIEDVQVNDLVLSLDGKYRSVIEKKEISDWDEDLYKITPCYRHSGSLCLTGNHWIPVVRKKEVLDIQVRDLKSTDYLIYPLVKDSKDLPIIDLSKYLDKRSRYKEDGTIVCWKYFIDAKPVRYRAKYAITNDMLYVLGFMLSNRNMRKRFNKASSTNIIIYKNRSEYMAEFIKKLKNIFDVDVTISTGTNHKITLPIPELRSWIDAYCISDNNEPIIPGFIKELPPTRLVYFLKGAWEAIGNSPCRGKYFFSSSRHSIITDLFDCLLKVNIVPKIKYDLPHKQSYLKIKDGYAIKAIQAGQVPKANLDNKYKYFLKNQVLFFRARSIEKIDKINLPIYDLTIDEIHYYTSEGIAVHNTEFYRRINPKERTDLWSVNPLYSETPFWFPKNYFIPTDTGDIYTKFPMGESRLPGPGLEERYPDLKGLEADEYPLIYQFKVLGEVFPYSKEYQTTKQKLLNMYLKDQLSKEQKVIFEETLEQVTDRVKKVAFREPEGGGLLGGYFRTVADVMQANPIEFITPFSPAHKFLGRQEAPEHYKENVIYGNAFTPWDSPVKSFILPAIRQVGDIIGLDHVPEEVELKREIEEYFDKLKFLKYHALEQRAIESKDFEAAQEYQKDWQRTLIGLSEDANVYDVMAAAPAAEKPYVKELFNVPSEDRSELLQYLPRNMRYFYEKAWGREVERDRGQELAEFFEAHRLPDGNSLIWNPKVNLEDVKLKVIERLGLNLHDFGIWNDQIRASKAKPYLDELADQLLAGPRFFQDSPDQVMEQLGIYNRSSYSLGSNSNGFEFIIKRDRENEIKKELLRRKNE